MSVQQAADIVDPAPLPPFALEKIEGVFCHGGQPQAAGRFAQREYCTAGMEELRSVGHFTRKHTSKHPDDELHIIIPHIARVDAPITTDNA